MKCLSTRGEYWVDARESVTIVIEKATPATVIMELAIAESISREPSALNAKTAGREDWVRGP